MNLYKYLSLANFDLVLDIILNERLYCPPYNELNDPFEGLFFSFYPGAFSPAFSTDFDSTRKCKPLTEIYKICSLSSSIEDVRLWSYYADGFKGIAIEIDIPKGVYLREVNYVDNLPTFDSQNPNPLEVLSHKTKHWEYEKEFRIIQEKVEFYPVNRGINAIYLGNRISQIHLDLLKKIVPNKIHIYETEIDPGSIKVFKKC